MCEGPLPGVLLFREYLSVDDCSHPEAFGWPGHRQHGPHEDEDGQDEGEQRRRHNVIEDDDKVAQHLRLRHHGVVEGKDQLQWTWKCQKKLVRVCDLIILKYSVGRGERR